MLVPLSYPTKPQVGVEEDALLVVLTTWLTLEGLDCVDDVFELVALDDTLATVAVVVLTELVVLVFVLVLVLLDVVDFTVLVGSATDFVVYGTTVVFTGTVEVTVLVVLMKQVPPREKAQLVDLMVVVVSKWSLVLVLTDLVDLLQDQYRSKTHKR